MLVWINPEEKDLGSRGGRRDSALPNAGNMAGVIAKHSGHRRTKSTFFAITWSYFWRKNVSFFPGRSITFFFRR
jgi:hypothetical protein